MPRPPRVLVENGVYHVTARGNRGELVFPAPTDSRLFLELLARVCRRRGWACLSYCLMPNHFHLVLRTPKPDLSAGMQYLNGVYAQWFNERHGFKGHLFGGRFFSRLVEREEHALELARYVVLNPVRARLVPEPSEWPWSSYRACLARAPRPAWLATDWLEDLLDVEPDALARTFASFVRAAEATSTTAMSRV
jgi:putative transposase